MTQFIHYHNHDVRVWWVIAPYQTCLQGSDHRMISIYDVTTVL